MKESITLFRQAINDSADLQEKCNSIKARGGTEQDLVELGKENGHEFSAEELKEAYEQLQEDEDGELTEFEMAAVAGGMGEDSKFASSHDETWVRGKGKNCNHRDREGDRTQENHSDVTDYGRRVPIANRSAISLEPRYGRGKSGVSMEDTSSG